MMFSVGRPACPTAAHPTVGRRHSSSLTGACLCPGCNAVTCVVPAGVPREPGGSTFLLKERQTSVQEARSRHQRVDNDHRQPTQTANNNCVMMQTKKFTLV